MRVSTLVSSLAIPAFAYAAPVLSRATVVGPHDVAVLQFANVLEQLETAFYQQALAKFQAADFIAAGYTSADVVQEQIESIALDESTHTQALASAITALGAEPITTCTFDFSSVLTDVQTMISTARVIENVGVGAYLGSANLLSNGILITEAATIVTIESRHSTILNLLNGGTSIPQAFDIPLSASQVVGIASPFISGCDLGFAPNPALTVTNTGAVGPGTLLTFDSPALQSQNTSSLFCNMIVGGAAMAISLPLDNCVVPTGIDGPVVISLSNSSQPLLGADIIDQATNSIVAGPIVTFIDAAPQQAIAQLALAPGSPFFRDGGNNGNDTTLTPAQASSVASSAVPTDSAANVAGGATPAVSATAASAPASTSAPVAVTSAGPGIVELPGTTDAGTGGAADAGGAANVAGAPTAAASTPVAAASANGPPLSDQGGLVVLPSTAVTPATTAAATTPTVALNPATAADGGALGVFGFDPAPSQGA